MTKGQRHLPRLEAQHYRGQAFVHWVLTMEDRSTGWLDGEFLACFRALLVHTTFRYGVTCPVFCLMPDHIHLVWLGLFDASDQLNAMKYLRRHLKTLLRKNGSSLQHQSYDRVLREVERKEDAFVDLCDYIVRNPERKGLVPPNAYATYPYSACLVPGYPELNLWQDDYWERFWRTYSFSSKHGLFRSSNEMI